MTLSLKHIYVATLLLSVMVVKIQPCIADDLDGLFAKRLRLDRSILLKLDSIDFARRILAQKAHDNPSSSGLEGVVQRMLIWQKPSLSVCFMDGKLALWDEVRSIASLWTGGSGIIFDFGVGGPHLCNPSQKVEDVRVSFHDASSYAEVGTKANFLPPELSTVNLGGLDSAVQLSSTQRGTILHEFGHVLGFEHETRSPNSNCEAELNWPYLYQRYGSKDLVDQQMRQILSDSDRTGLIATAFDQKSVMLYALPREAFKDINSATCFLDNHNDELSEKDLQTEKAIYPAR